MAKKEKRVQKIFVGIPKGLSKEERAFAIEEIKSRVGEEFGEYVVPVRNGKLITLLKYLNLCDAAMFAKDLKDDSDMLVCVDVCRAFNIPIYK